MTITITYQPNKGFSLGDTLLLWETDRQKTRSLINDIYKISDSVTDLSQYYNGDTSQNIIQRRDIYTNYKGQDNFFFLNFDKNDRLIELELHQGFVININGVIFDFSMDIEKVAELLNSISGNKKQLSEGEYFFENLKLTIASGEASGGEGNEFSYFYCSKDIEHLIDN